MKIRERLEILIEEMLDGHILLDEARVEFEKLYVQKALEKYDSHLTHTAAALGIHRNTLAKKLATYQAPIQNNHRRLLIRRTK